MGGGTLSALCRPSSKFGVLHCSLPNVDIRCSDGQIMLDGGQIAGKQFHDERDSLGTKQPN